MATLYVTEQSAILRKTGDRLIVEKERTVLLEVPCLKLDAVLIFGNVQVTTQALVELLDHGIELAIFSLGGKLRGQLTPPKAKNVPLRMAQYEATRSETVCLPIAQEMVRGKIANGIAVLRRFHKNHPEAFPLQDVEEMERVAGRVETARAIDSLLGIEGAAAALYFKSLAAMVPSWVGFQGRNRRPPRDPLNALLSFGYVLVGNELQSLLDGMGFDPYLGLYHRPDYGRPSLALDLLEELRPALVDRWSTALLNLGTFARNDFVQTPEGGVLLGRESLRRYLPAYEEEVSTPFSVDGEMLTFREIFRRQAERLARTVLDGEPYRSFRLPC